MISFDFKVIDPEGLHARPAGLLVKAAKGVASKVTITKEGKSADASKMFGLMGLSIKGGNTITVTVEGDSEAADAEVIKSCLKEAVGDPDKA